MIASRHALLVAAVTSSVLLLRRRAVWPAAVALTVLTAISYARPRLGPGAAAFLWLLWPAPAAALACRAWPGLARPWVVTLAHVTYAAGALLVPWSWTEGTWAVALRAPFWAGALVGTLAWARGRREEGDRVVRQIAALLTLSAALDVTVGSLAPSAPWSLRLTWLTWIAVEVALLRGHVRD